MVSEWTGKEERVGEKEEEIHSGEKRGKKSCETEMKDRKEKEEVGGVDCNRVQEQKNKWER